MKNTDIYISSKDSKEGDKRKFYRVSNQAVIESLNSEEKLNICEFLAEYEMTFFEIKELIDEVWGLFYIEDNALMLPYHLLSRIRSLLIHMSLLNDLT